MGAVDSFLRGRVKSGMRKILSISILFLSTCVYGNEPSSEDSLSRCIAFIRNKNLWTMNDHGENQRQITNMGDLGSDISWSFDNTKIFFERKGKQFRETNIWSVKPDNGEVRQLTNNKRSGSPSCHPTKPVIAFEHIHNFDGDLITTIKLMDFNGEVLKEFSNVDGNQPKFIFNGEKILFHMDSFEGLGLIDVETSKHEKFASFGKAVTTVCFSPVGRYYAQSGYLPDGDRQGIWVINADGSQKKMIFTSSKNWDFIQIHSWSNDGKSILFTSHKGKTINIWKINVDGVGLKMLAKNAYRPIWFHGIEK
jgi:Tol biopolymer transport system component